MIRFCCSECGKIYCIPDKYAGKKARCKCRQVNTIPLPEYKNMNNGDSITAYNSLLKELAKDEKTAPTVEIES